jgi:uncharacterized protein YciI
MPFFVIYAKDRANSAQARATSMDAHKAYGAEISDLIRTAGVLLDEAGVSVGSMFVIEARDKQSVDALVAREPFVTEGVFESVEVHAFRWVIGVPT